MTKYNQNFELIQGDDKNLAFYVVDENGDPYNLTGATIAFVVRKQLHFASNIISKTTGGSGISIANGNGTGDKVTVDIDPADTASISFKPGISEMVYEFDLEATESGGEVVTIARGTMTLKRDAA